MSFSGNGTGTFTAEVDVNDRLLSVAGGYRYIDVTERSQESYDSAGKLTAIQWAGGGTATFTYSNTSTAAAPAAGYLVQVKDSYGRSTNFAYQLPSGGNPETDGLLSSVTDAASQSMSLSYDSQSNLATITWADGKSRLFHYEIPSFPHALTGITDELGVRYATFGYDSAGRAISTEHIGGLNRYSSTYGTPPQVAVTEVYDTATQVLYRTHDWTQALGTVVTTPQGASQSMSTTVINGKSYLTSQSQVAGSGCAASTSFMTYDVNGSLASKDDFTGNRSCFASDLTRNLRTTTVDGMANSDSCATVLPTSASLPAGSRKTTTEWHPDWPLPTRVAEPGRRTTYVYNGQPDPTAANAILTCAPAAATLSDGKLIAVLCRQVVQATTDTDGSLGISASLDVSVAASTAQWTYTTQGLVVTATDANLAVTQYSYDSLGQVGTVTNAIGHMTSYTQYDGVGRLKQSVDPKGITTDITYTPRGWVSGITATPSGGISRLTSYTYDAIGQLTAANLPDGTTLGYSYDSAHRLVGITDTRGNTVTYTLDNVGNRITEDTKDPQGTLVRNITRIYDALNRVQQTTGANN